MENPQINYILLKIGIDAGCVGARRRAKDHAGGQAESSHLYHFCITVSLHGHGLHVLSKQKIPIEYL